MRRDADTIFDDNRERLFLVDEIEKQPGIAGGDVEIAEGPSVPADGGKCFAGVFFGPAFGICAERGMPIVAFEASTGLAGVDDDPSCGAGAEGAVGVADERVVFAGRALVGGEEIRFRVSVRADDDAMIAARIRHGAQCGLNGMERLGPG